MREELFDHLKAVVTARQHSRQVATMLRRELPVMLDERVRYLRRRLRIAIRRTRTRRPVSGRPG